MRMNKSLWNLNNWYLRILCSISATFDKSVIVKIKCFILLLCLLLIKDRFVL